jgi:hypothetical protein
MKLNKAFIKKTLAMIIFLFFLSVGTVPSLTGEILQDSKNSEDKNLDDFLDISNNNNFDLQNDDKLIENRSYPENSNTVVLLESTFENEWIYESHQNYPAPPEWTIEGISSSYQQSASYKTHYFSKIDKNEAPELVHSGNASVGVWWKDDDNEANDIGMIQDEWLISPSLNIKNLHNVELSFWSIYCPTQVESMPFYVEYRVDNSYSIKVSFDDGMTWRTAADLRDSAFKLGVDLASEYIDNDFGNGGFFNYHRLRGDFFNMFDELVVIPLSFSESERSIGDNVRIAWHYNYDNSSDAQAIWVIDDVHITANQDQDKPTINLIEPQKNSLYIDNSKIDIPIDNTFIVGSVDIKVDARDYETGIKHVEYFINGRLKEKVQSRPFTWSWDDSSFGRYTLTVKATDFAGNVGSDEITIWKFF